VFEAATKQLRANVDALDQHLVDATLSNKARGIIVCVKDVLIEQAYDIYANRRSYGLTVAEAIPFGVGTVVTVGRAVYDGEKSAGEVAGTLVVEAVLGIFGVNAIKLVAKSVTKFGAKLVTKVAEKAIPRQNKVHLSSEPKMVKHHIFNAFHKKNPKSQKYIDFFKKHGIKVDDYCIRIPETTHKLIIHGKGNDWTKEWKQFIDANPQASTNDVYQFGGMLMEKYKVSHLPIIKYK
jgi:hypothetical protein